MSDRKSSVYRLTESAILLAIAAVLSVIKLVDMPYGGSVTAFSMLPLLIIAYRHGTRWGLFTAFTYSLIQLLLGLDNFSYATSFLAVVMIALFDYLLAFFALGLGGVFRKKLPQGAALSAAAIVSGVLRYLCHFVTGFTVWRDLSLPTGQAFAYSLVYNATYMVPEIIILVLGCVYLSRFLSLDNANISRTTNATSKTSLPETVLSVTSSVVLLVVIVGTLLYISPFFQSSSDEPLFAHLASANWPAVSLFAGIGLAVFAILKFIATKLAGKK